MNALNDVKQGLRKGWHWLFALGVSMALVACGGGSSDPAPAPTPEAKARTTVLVYMVGSDLEGDPNAETGETSDMATFNLNEMMRVGSTDEVQVILETGGANKEGWRTVKRQRVEKGRMQVIEDLGAQRMSDPDHLRKFVEWGVKAYPAQSYHLIFWNHGGGPVQGFGSDENYPNTGMMSMASIAEALDQAKQTTQVKMDLIGFDACLMASVEIAQVLSPYGNYLLASEDIEPGPGWDWSVYLQYMVDNKDSTAVSTGKAIMAGYIQKMSDMGATAVTASLVDLNKVPALSQSLANVFSTVSQRLLSESGYEAWAELAYARRSSFDFQTSWFFGGDYDLVDLGDFIVAPKFSDLGVTQAQVDVVQEALQEAVVEARNGADFSSASGLTMYFPLVSVNEPLIYEKYDTLDIPRQIKAVVRQYLTIANQQDWPQPLVGALRQGQEATVIEADVANPAFAAVGYAVLWQEEADTKKMLAMKPLDANSDQSQEDPTESQAALRIAADFQSGWFAMQGKSGSIVPVAMLPDDRQLFDVEAVRQHLVPVMKVSRLDERGQVSVDRGSLIVRDMPDDQGGRVLRVVGFIESDNNPYASRPDIGALDPEGRLFVQRWNDDREFGEREWQDLTMADELEVKAFGDVDTPRSAWWTLQRVNVSEDMASVGLCSGTAPCSVELGVVDYKGRFHFNEYEPEF